MIIEDTECQSCKFAAIQYLNKSVQFYLSNGKLYYFSHLHYTNWGEMWPQLYVLSLGHSNQETGVGNYQRQSVCLTACFYSQMNCNIRSHSNWHETGVEKRTCVEKWWTKHIAHVNHLSQKNHFCHHTNIFKISKYSKHIPTGLHMLANNIWLQIWNNLKSSKYRAKKTLLHFLQQPGPIKHWYLCIIKVGILT